MKKITLFTIALLLVAGCEHLSKSEKKSASTKKGGSILFLSKSSGFEHSSIKWDDQKNNHVGTILKQISPAIGKDVLCTKDASLINAENLKNFKLVIFYTTGDLTQEGTDKQPAMSATGQDELCKWIQNGGGFMGFHCASDTFHTPEGQPVTPYVDMIGGEFRTHGKQFEGTVKIVDTSHPTTMGLPREWKQNDEWYLFKNLNVKTMHIIALMDPGAERANQEAYNIPAYPVVWCSQYGKGRVYYNAMGHREDVWTNQVFQKAVVNAALWTMGIGPAAAAPNATKIMSEADLIKVQAAVEKK